MLKIVVTVSEESETHTDYVGFEGVNCLTEGERFHALLAQFGVQMETTRKTPKPELLNALVSQHERLSLEEQHHEVGTEG